MGFPPNSEKSWAQLHQGDDEESQLLPQANQHGLNLLLGQSAPFPAARWITLSMEGTVNTPLGANRDPL